MNVVFISPNFPPNYYMFPVRLCEEGARVLGIGEAPFHSLRPELRAALTDYIQVHEMESYDAMLRALGLFTHRHGKLDWLDSNNEHWLELEARLREDFNLPGQRPCDTAVNRSKLAMKETLRRAGLPCGPGERVETPEQARQFASEHGYPLILKPDVGVGASGATRVDDARGLDDALARMPPGAGLVIEKFLSGELVSFDGLTDRDGTIVLATSHVFNDGIMEVVSGRRPMHYYSVREVPADLDAIGRRVVAAFGIRARFFHIEFFRLADGSLRVLELNVRPPGGYTTEMFNYAADIDVYRMWAQIVTGHFHRDAVPVERKYHVAHVGRRSGRQYAMGHDELLGRLGDKLLFGIEMPPVLSGAMGDYAYLLRARELTEVEDAIRTIEREA